MECRGINAEHAPCLLPAHLHTLHLLPTYPVPYMLHTHQHASQQLLTHTAPHVQPSHVLSLCQNSYMLQKLLES